MYLETTELEYRDSVHLLVHRKGDTLATCSGQFVLPRRLSVDSTCPTYADDAVKFLLEATLYRAPRGNNPFH